MKSRLLYPSLCNLFFLTSCSVKQIIAVTPSATYEITVEFIKKKKRPLGYSSDRQGVLRCCQLIEGVAKSNGLLLRCLSLLISANNAFLMF